MLINSQIQIGGFWRAVTSRPIQNLKKNTTILLLIAKKNEEYDHELCFDFICLDSLKKISLSKFGLEILLRPLDYIK